MRVWPFCRDANGTILVPDCVSHCFDISLKIKNSASLEQFLTKSKRNLLSILIRSKYSEINDINRCLKERKSKLSERTRTQLMPILCVGRERDSRKIKENCHQQVRQTEKCTENCQKEHTQGILLDTRQLQNNRQHCRSYDCDRWHQGYKTSTSGSCKRT